MNTNISKIFIDNKEVSINSIVNGRYNIGKSNTTAQVKIVLKDNTYIPEYLFANCETLKKVYIPKTVNTIKRGAFANSGISEIEGFSYVSYAYTGIFYNTYITPENISSYISYTSYNSYIYSYISYLFDNPISYNQNSYSYSYSYTNNNQNSYSYSYTNNNYNPEDYSYIEYNIGDTFICQLSYIERNDYNTYCHIGEAQLTITDINEDNNEYINNPHDNPYKIKVYIDFVNAFNPINDINYEYELMYKYFWTDDKFITYNKINQINYSNLIMKYDDDTYYPELEYSNGLTNYSLIKDNRLA